MLHLPHNCPACDGVHVPTRSELPAASALRPYFGTYTPSKFPAGTTTTPLQFISTLTTTSQNYNTNTVIPIASPSTNTIAASPASGNTITLTKTGIYVIQAFGAYNHDSQQQLFILINGTPTGTSHNGLGFSGTPGAYAILVPTQLSTGTTIGFRGYYTGPDIGAQNFPDAGSLVHITFVPTPTYPQ